MDYHRRRRTSLFDLEHVAILLDVSRFLTSHLPNTTGPSEGRFYLITLYCRNTSFSAGGIAEEDHFI
jgi:hypothetical protein